MLIMGMIILGIRFMEMGMRMRIKKIIIRNNAKINNKNSSYCRISNRKMTKNNNSF